MIPDQLPAGVTLTPEQSKAFAVFQAAAKKLQEATRAVQAAQDEYRAALGLFSELVAAE